MKILNKVNVENLMVNLKFLKSVLKLCYVSFLYPVVTFMKMNSPFSDNCMNGMPT